MGYSSEIGFRAGVCTPFNFYDLENDYETTLEIQPFAIMDTAMKTYLNLSPDEAFLKIRTMIDEIKHVEGTFYGIWHNSNLCNDFGWEDWHLVFEQTLEYANMITNKIR
jgi:predicted metallopeptidase